MERAMKRSMTLAGLLLRARLRLGRINPVVALAVALVAAGIGAQLALLPARQRLDAEYEQARRLARMPAPVAAPVAAPPPSSDQNLQHFYATLGDRRGVERQLKEVFALAARHGLTLSQGEYRSANDRNARLSTYQVNLPVKGSYGAILGFALDVLRAMPHASLDDVAFRRDAIGDAGVEARLRLTFYLAPVPGTPGAPR
jgi:hypothetical protein